MKKWLPIETDEECFEALHRFQELKNTKDTNINDANEYHLLSILISEYQEEKEDELLRLYEENRRLVVWAIIVSFLSIASTVAYFLK